MLTKLRTDDFFRHQKMNTSTAVSGANWEKNLKNSLNKLLSNVDTNIKRREKLLNVEYMSKYWIPAFTHSSWDPNIEGIVVESFWPS